MIHTLRPDNWSLDSSENSSDCNSNHHCRCKDPNSANTDCRPAAAAAGVPEPAKGFDSAEVEVAVAEQMLTAAGDGMACTTPWLDFDTQ